jgi:hypothetical protein
VPDVFLEACEVIMARHVDVPVQARDFPFDLLKDSVQLHPQDPFHAVPPCGILRRTLM